MPDAILDATLGDLAVALLGFFQYGPGLPAVSLSLVLAWCRMAEFIR